MFYQAVFAPAKINERRKTLEKKLHHNGRGTRSLESAKAAKKKAFYFLLPLLLNLGGVSHNKS